MSGLREGHPGTDELTAFDRGRLRPAEWEAVERHVASCDDCCRRLEALAEDSLAAFLRTSAVPPPSPEVTCAVSADGQPVASQADVPAELADHPRYRVIGVLGEGGMGTVYRAEHRLMGRTVALKVIRKSLTDRADAAERFRQEVKAAARLSHPNIVAAYDAEQAGGLHFLVMEYVEGTSLDELVRRHGPLPSAEACDVVRQAALGLQHAHERGMVHRDIKPHNLLRTPERRVKVLDFGLARFVSETGGSLTEPGSVLGTPDYLAPEQALDAHQADIRSDIYALGCTLYFLLTGRPPFADGSALQKLLAHQQRRPTPLAELRPDVPAGLPDVLDRLMAKEPDRRCQSPAEVVELLTPFAGGETLPAAPRMPRPDAVRTDDATIASPIDFASAGKGTGRRRRYAVVLVVAAMACLVFLILAGSFLGPIWQRHRAATTHPAEEPLADGEVRRVRSSRPATFYRAVVAADCRLALTAGNDSDFTVWDLERGRPAGELQAIFRPVALAISRDGRQALTTGVNGELYRWDLEQRRPINSSNFQHLIRSADFVPGTNLVITGEDSGRVRFYDAVDNRVLGEVKMHKAPVYYVRASRSGRYAVSAGGDGMVWVWNPSAQKEVQCLSGHDGAVSCAVLSRDNQRVLSGGTDQTVRQWDLTHANWPPELRGHTAEVTAAAISSDNRLGLSGDRAGVLRVWDLQSGESLRTYEVPNGRAVRAVEFCPDGRQFVTADEGGSFRFWRLP